MYIEALSVPIQSLTLLPTKRASQYFTTTSLDRMYSFTCLLGSTSNGNYFPQLRNGEGNAENYEYRMLYEYE